MCVSSEDSPTLTFMSKWKSLVAPLIVELLRVLLLSRHRQHTHRTDIPPCFLTRRQANATALRWTRAPPLHHTSPTKGTCTCVCSLRWKVNILVRNDRSQETENKATPQTESSRVIINVMSTKKKKKKYTIQLSLPTEHIKTRLKIHSSVSKGMKCMKGSTLQHMAVTSLALILTRWNAKPFFSCDNKTRSVKDYN